MGPSTNARLQEKLRQVEGRLMAAVVTGADSLMDFRNAWSSLQTQIEAKRKSSSLDEETCSLAYTVSCSVEFLLKHFAELEVATSTLSSQLVSQLDAMLNTDLPLPKSSSHNRLAQPNISSLHPFRLPKPSLQSLRHPTTTPITSALATILPSRYPPSTGSVTGSSRSVSDPNPLPEFIEHAYKFFLANIFNPYPTREEKQAIVDKTNNSRVTVTSVANWFTNARRRCGWAEILKGRCDGNRDKMVDLATRVFIKPDPCHPVDPQVVKEMVEMKESLESMYQRKTRTSAWIDEIEGMEELINPVPEEERLAAKKRETEAEREARRRRKEMLKEQRDFERRKCKMQAEALRKAEKVAKQVQREQKKQEKEKNKERNELLFIMSYPATEVDEEESVSEPRLVVGGKRKFGHNDSSSYDFPGLRHMSPAYSLSSSFNSDLSSDGRVPSLTWSDSGDEQRPYKRSSSRSSSSTPYINSSSLSPALEIPASFDYSFTFEPPTGLTDDPAVNSIFDFSISTSENRVATLPRGQKRLYDMEDGELTPQAKRVKTIVASTGPNLAPAPSAPLFMPTPSANGSPTGAVSRRSCFAPVDLDAVLGLGNTSPQSVQNPQPDASLPVEIGVFDWSTSANPAISLPGASGTGDSSPEFAQLFQLFTEQLPPPTFEGSEQTEQRLDAQLEVPSFDLSTSDFLLQHPTHTTSSLSQLEGGHNIDLSGLMSGFMSEVAFNDLGLKLPESTHFTHPDLSQSASVSPAWTPIPAAPSGRTSPTPEELVEKAMSKERKRREIEERKAELERELAELERDD